MIQPFGNRTIALLCFILLSNIEQSLSINSRSSNVNIISSKKSTLSIQEKSFLKPLVTSSSTTRRVSSRKKLDRDVEEKLRGGSSASIEASDTSNIMSEVEKSTGLPSSMKLIVGAGGIYAAFLYYGSLQEDVFRYRSSDGSSFKAAWFLQVLEALANVIIGFVGMQLSGATAGIPKQMFAISGAAQVSAKACTSLALANGLSFPVATLAKSGKMAPVMAGSLLLGGATYTLREYVQVLAIIGGTAVVSMGKKKGASNNSSTGVAYIILSLVLDGVTAGFQKRLMSSTAKAGVKPKPYDFMFWTNLFMAITAIFIAGALGEIQSGMAFCLDNPEILTKISYFALCSAVGQSFIFYTIANFDPLVLSTITTTRKIFSVLLSIFLKGHSLNLMGWSGIGMACCGIISELLAKSQSTKLHSK